MGRREFVTSDMLGSGMEGNPVDALFELGLMHATGRDVKLDFVLAHKFFNLAAMRGNDDAKRFRAEIAREMTKREIANAQKLAREWLSKH